jgi:hypothetical protein
MFKNPFKNMFERKEESKKTEPGKFDAPPGVDPEYFTEIVGYLQANNFDQSKATSDIIRNLGKQASDAGSDFSFTESLFEEAKQIALDPSHKAHQDIITHKKIKEDGVGDTKRNQIERAYNTKFDPDQKYADLEDEKPTQLD